MFLFLPQIFLRVALVGTLVVGVASAQANRVTEYSTRAGALLAKGKFYEAEQWYRLALREEQMQLGASPSHELRLALAGVLARQGPYGPSVSEARIEFEKLVRQLPQSVAVLAGAAAGFSFLGDQKSAGDLFLRAAGIAPDDKLRGVLMRNRATVLLQGDDVTEGICSSGQAYQLAPSSSEAAAHLSELSRLGRLVEAIEFGERALATVGPSPELLNRLAAAYLARNDCGAAIAIVRRVLESGRAPEDDRKNAEVLVSLCENGERAALARLSAAGSWPIQFRLPDVAGEND